MGMHSVYIQQLVWPVAAPLVMRMCGYTGGVATRGVLPYPAIYPIHKRIPYPFL